jgi:hypothetical protein
MPSNNFTAPLAYTLLVEVSWLAACMAAECGISRLVQLVPPAHHHFTLSQSSNRPNALFPCPVAILLPPWLLHYLWRSHGWLPAWQQSAEFTVLVRLVPPAHHHFTLSPSSNRPNALFSCPVTTLLPPWLLHYLWRSHGWLPTWQHFQTWYGLCLQRTTILHFPQAPTGLTHYSHAQ